MFSCGKRVAVQEGYFGCNLTLTTVNMIVYNYQLSHGYQFMFSHWTFLCKFTSIGLYLKHGGVWGTRERQVIVALDCRWLKWLSEESVVFGSDIVLGLGHALKSEEHVAIVEV